MSAPPVRRRVGTLTVSSNPKGHPVLHRLRWWRVAPVRGLPPPTRASGVCPSGFVRRGRKAPAREGSGGRAPNEAGREPASQLEVHSLSLDPPMLSWPATTLRSREANETRVSRAPPRSHRRQCQIR